jgi:voltage-gated potassium channel
MSRLNEDRRSLVLLLSVLLFVMLHPFIESSRIGGLILLLLVYLTLATAALDLHEKGTFGWIALFLVLPSMLATLVGVIHPARTLVIVNFASMALIFALVSVGLFSYLGQPGSITSGRIYASASLYLILALFWFALYNVCEEVHPGSFVHMAATGPVRVLRSEFTYFSLITLTTVGYGDIVPVSPVTRTLAALEGATGVLYIAITVARLVAAYQQTDDRKKQR